MAETMVPPVEYPAAEAVDCMQLFSRMVMSLVNRTGSRVRRVFQMV